MNRKRPVLIMLLALVLLGPFDLLAARAAPAAPAAPPTAQSAVGLDWGYKDSWRSYIGNKGIRTLDGATRNDDGTFHFPVATATYDAAAQTTTVDFTGSIDFRGYCQVDLETPRSCLLWSVIARPRLVISPKEQVLTAEVASAPRDKPGAVKDYGRIPLARLGIGPAAVATTDGVTRWTGVRTVLTDEAGGDPTSYPAGSALDDVAFSYRGEGGKPELGERFAPPGLPTFAEELRQPMVTADPVARPSIHPSATSPVFFTATSEFVIGNPQTVFVAHDEQGKKELARESVPFTGVAPVAFDPVTNSLFTVRKTDERTELVRLQWSQGRFVVTVLADVGGAESRNYPLLAWNGSSLLLVVVPRTERPQVVEWREGAIPARHDLPFVDEVAGLNQIDRKRTRQLYYGTLPGTVDGRTLFLSQEYDSVQSGQTGGALTVISLAGDRPVVGRHRQFGAVVPVAAGNGQVVLHGLPGNPDLHTTRWGPDAQLAGAPTTTQARVGDGPPVTLTYGGGVGDGAGTVYLPTRDSNQVMVVRDGAVVTLFDARGTQTSLGTNSIPLGHARDGVYALARRGNEHEVVRVARRGVTATFATQPQSREVTLIEGQRSQEVTLSAAAEASPTPALQWQQKLAGDSVFTDIAGATAGEVRVRASVNADGAQYRAVARNAAGAVASDVATLTVHSAPLVESQPVKAEVYEHQPATFSVLVTGTGPLRTGWEFRAAGKSIWTPLAADSDFVVDGTTLRISRPGLDLDGFHFRAVVGNDYGVTRSDAAVLKVQKRPGNDAKKTFTGVTFDWAGSTEWQSRPPNGSAAHYFSAGTSDGTQGTYRASADGASILQRDRQGRDRPATWGERGAHVVDNGNQVVRLTNGTAVIDPNGSTTIDWPATFSVNFYDGLVPSTMSNLKLAVAPDGRGELRADLAGYAGDMANPTKPKEAVPARTGVVMATFRNVVVDPARGFVITPDYAGVRLNTPAGETAQKRAGEGWGSWPQEFVDFHFTTHLAAYFYSTGGTFDPHKAPAAIGIGFAGAVPEVPGPPAPAPGGPPGAGAPPGIAPAPPVVSLPGGDGRGGINLPPSTGGAKGVEGTLLWGVKESFRSYISGPVAKGRITLVGAGSDGGAFRFGQVDTDWRPQSATGNTRYRGGVKFWGHGGILDITMSDPAIRIEPGGRGTLMMKVAGPGLGGGAVALGDLDLGAAAKQSAAGGVAYNNVPVTLTAAGSKVFSYGSSVFYQPGTRMDPLSFVVGVNARPGSVGAGVPPREGAVIDPRAGGPGRSAMPRAGVPRIGAGGALAAPAAEVGCKVEKATMQWGFKESFRAYISGSIAHGAWETTDGAGYRTPKFEWPAGAGRYDGRTRQGQVDFAGGIRFTGHDGLLDTRVSNPRIRFVDDRSAVLLLDVAGVTMEDALAGKKEPVVVREAPFANLDLAAGSVQVSPDGKTITAENVPTSLTEQGFVAFPNYPVGTAFDSLSFSLTTGQDCVAAPEARGNPAALQGAAPEAVVSDGSGPGGIGWPWLAGIGGGIALLAAGLSTTVALLLHRSTMKTMVAALGAGAATGVGAGGAGVDAPSDAGESVDEPASSQDDNAGGAS